MIANANNRQSQSRRIVIPVTPLDRQRLHEIHEKMGSWTAVSEALGFRGASTARKWALSNSTTFKGKDYPERIRQLHERLVGKPVVMKPTTTSDPRMERVETMVETLLSALGIDPSTLASPKVSRKIRELREAAQEHPAPEPSNNNATK